MERPCVLIVDDNEKDKEIITDILVNEEKLTLAYASNGFEALEKARIHQPDLILLDILMPGLGGIETCRKIREDKMLADVPILILTGLTSKQDRLNALNAGADDFITKPVTKTILLSRVKTILRLNRYRKLLEERARFESLVKVLPDGIVLTNEKGKILLVNESLCSMCGLGEKALVNSYLDEILHSNTGDSDDFSAILQSNQVERQQLVEGHIHGKTDSTVAVEFLHTKVRWEQNECFLYVIRDISQRKKMQRAQTAIREQLYHSQKMEAVGLLASGTVHELRNLLAVIRGFTTFAQQENIDQSTLSDSLQEVLKAEKRAEELVKNLLMISRKDAISYEMVDCKEAVRSVSKVLAKSKSTTVRIKTEVEPDVWGVLASPSMVTQILTNLGLNALDAMPDGGELRIEARNAPQQEFFDESRKEMIRADYVVFSVSDTGIGMEQATEKRIFEPFFTTKPKTRGTGLGLTMIFTMVKELKGFIDVKTELGKGTTFDIFLPKHEVNIAHSIHSKEQQIELVHGQGEQVLVIESETGIQQLLIANLTLYGYRVTCCFDFEDFDTRLRHLSREFDVFIIDAFTPKKDKKHIADYLLEEEPTRKILISSTHNPKEVVQWPVKASLPIVEKPFDMVKLLTLLHKVIHDEAQNKEGPQ